MPKKYIAKVVLDGWENPSEEKVIAVINEKMVCHWTDIDVSYGDLFVDGVPAVTITGTNRTTVVDVALCLSPKVGLHEVVEKRRKWRFTMSNDGHWLKITHDDLNHRPYLMVPTPEVDEALVRGVVELLVAWAAKEDVDPVFWDSSSQDSEFDRELGPEEFLAMQFGDKSTPVYAFSGVNDYMLRRYLMLQEMLSAGGDGASAGQVSGELLNSDPERLRCIIKGDRSWLLARTRSLNGDLNSDADIVRQRILPELELHRA